MMKNDNRKIIYSLNIEDIQNVARQEIERELTSSEVKLVVDEIQKRIPWYETIAGAVAEIASVQKLR